MGNCLLIQTQTKNNQLSLFPNSDINISSSITSSSSVTKTASAITMTANYHYPNFYTALIYTDPIKLPNRKNIYVLLESSYTKGSGISRLFYCNTDTLPTAPSVYYSTVNANNDSIIPGNCSNLGDSNKKWIKLPDTLRGQTIRLGLVHCPSGGPDNQDTYVLTHWTILGF